MRRWFGAVVAAGLVLAGHSFSVACGDKLLTLGRGIRFQSRHTPRPATVLLYVPTTARTSATVADPRLESALREAGHKVHTAVSGVEVEEALRSGRYDVVLADLPEIPEIEKTAAGLRPSPILLPVVAQGTAEEADAKKQFRIVLRIPGRTGHYCAAVDKAMELKLEAERRKPA
jgi:hypothetical protein